METFLYIVKYVVLIALIVGSVFFATLWVLTNVPNTVMALSAAAGWTFGIVAAIGLPELFKSRRH